MQQEDTQIGESELRVFVGSEAVPVRLTPLDQNAKATDGERLRTTHSLFPGRTETDESLCDCGWRSCCCRIASIYSGIEFS